MSPWRDGATAATAAAAAEEREWVLSRRRAISSAKVQLASLSIWPDVRGLGTSGCARGPRKPRATRPRGAPLPLSSLSPFLLVAGLPVGLQSDDGTLLPALRAQPAPPRSGC